MARGHRQTMTRNRAPRVQKVRNCAVARGHDGSAVVDLYGLANDVWRGYGRSDTERQKLKWIEAKGIADGINAELRRKGNYSP